MTTGVGEATADALEISLERTRILSALLDDAPELADRGAEAIRREIAAYATAGDRLFADMHEQVLLNYRTKLALLLEDRGATVADLLFVRQAAMRRARAEFALEDYINAFRVGQQVFWDALLERAGDSPVGHEAALSLVGPVMRYVDFVSTHAAHVYAEFQKYALVDDHRERRDLLEHLLAGEMPPSGPLLSAAQSYGLHCDSRIMVAIALPADRTASSDAVHSVTAALARTALAGGKTLVVARQAEIIAVPALIGDADPAQMCDLLERVSARLRREGVPLTVGVSTVAGGVAELPRAYLEARAALECLGTRDGILALPRLSPFQYLALRADDTARRLVDPRVRAFLDEDRARGDVLGQTLRAFADADLNVRVLAQRLHIHPNTAHYRLGRIRERTGRNPRTIADLLELMVAVALDG
ncbi:MAG TPA: helix-turn-helix domain-containing protein [Solirubrobacteraceae bacterium]|jgi:sugar diacid utilization regulator